MFNPFAPTVAPAAPHTRPLKGAVAAGTMARGAWEGARNGRAGSTQLAALSPSLLQDLMRFSPSLQADAGLDLLAVLAAAVRHSRAVRVLLAGHPRQIPTALTLFPQVGLAHCTVPVTVLLAQPDTDWRVQRVEPATTPAQAAAVPSPQGAAGSAHAAGTPAGALRLADTHLYTPLPQLLWQMAALGARDTLLPEIAGVAAYRVAPAADLRGLDMSTPWAAAVARLRHYTTNLRDIAAWPGMNAARAQRLLNGLYLQTALVVSRSHPAATNADWVNPLAA